MPTIFDHRDVNVDDVAFFQNLVAGNAVTNLMVDRSANGFGIRISTTGVVVEWGGNGVLNLGDVVMRQLIQGVGGDARLDVGGEVIQHLGGQSTGLPHACDALLIFVGNAHGGQLSQGGLLPRHCKGIPLKSGFFEVLGDRALASLIFLTQ